MDQYVVNSQAPTVPSTVLRLGQESPKQDDAIFCECENSGCCSEDCVCYFVENDCTELCWCKICDNRGGGRNEDQTDYTEIENAKPLAFKSKEMEVPQSVVDPWEYTQYNPRIKKVALKHCNCRESECLKLDCECFRSGAFCSKHCQCERCSNHAGEVEIDPEVLEKSLPFSLEQKEMKVLSLSINPTEISVLGPVPIPGRRSGPSELCSCRKSECLKIYCQCLAALSLCTERCGCQGCHNRVGNEERISMAVEMIRSTDPFAFAPKSIRIPDIFRDIWLEGSSSGTSVIAKDIRGCNCLNPGCGDRSCKCVKLGLASILCDDLPVLVTLNYVLLYLLMGVTKDSAWIGCFLVPNEGQSEEVDFGTWMMAGYSRGGGGGRGGATHNPRRIEKQPQADAWPKLADHSRHVEGHTAGQKARGRRCGLIVGRESWERDTYPEKQWMGGDLPPNGNPSREMVIH
ncbi:hypothetical protein J5N97_028501 [Dioscorea zingiberensis]|uniref:CRC domain-containing protein n=1 Tax=Dioscorea zingiberensis TaxID=325984 RepID=A0A9D5H4V4_9LILI|nr:hypothetical protein J5N97_028501 [Dioscorea zingiberensis]